MLKLGTIALAAFLAAAPARAEIIDARNFSPIPHAGTETDPWPGSAIAAAIASLPNSSGDTVLVTGGLWRVTSPIVTDKNGFTLSGVNRSGILDFHGSGQLLVTGDNPYTQPVRGVTLTGLKVRSAGINSESSGAVHLRNCVGCKVLGSAFGTRPKAGYIPVLFLEGGGNGEVRGTSFLDGYLQLNPFGSTLNAGFLISGNVFDSSRIHLIGVSDVVVRNNTLTNKTFSQPLLILVAPPYRGTSRNVRVEYNTLDATVFNRRGAVISGLPQDTGGKGTLRQFYIRYNKVKGSTANINAQVGAAGTFLETCIATCKDISDTYDIRIRGNTIEAYYDPAIIDVRGGTFGLVNGGIVAGNTLVTHWPGAINRILLDGHTSNVTIGANSLTQP